LEETKIVKSSGLSTRDSEAPKHLGRNNDPEKARWDDPSPEDNQEAAKLTPSQRAADRAKAAYELTAHESQKRVAHTKAV
jgi:hypothetical protein